jgi:hypothetical protein
VADSIFLKFLESSEPIWAFIGKNLNSGTMDSYAHFFSVAHGIFLKSVNAYLMSVSELRTGFCGWKGRPEYYGY